MIVYKIRRIRDGLYSKGGVDPDFNKTGKVWKQKGHLVNHIRQVSDWGRNWKTNKYMTECEIVEFEIKETQVSTMTIQEVVNEIQLKKEQQRIEQERRREEYQKERRRLEYEKLKLEFENE